MGALSKRIMSRIDYCSRIDTVWRVAIHRVYTFGGWRGDSPSSSGRLSELFIYSYFPPLARRLGIIASELRLGEDVGLFFCA